MWPQLKASYWSEERHEWMWNLVLAAVQEQIPAALYSGGKSCMDTSCLCDVLSRSKSRSLSLQVQWSLVWPTLTHMLHVHSPVQLRSGCFSKVTSLSTYIQRTRTRRIFFFFLLLKYTNTGKYLMTTGIEYILTHFTDYFTFQLTWQLNILPSGGVSQMTLMCRFIYLFIFISSKDSAGGRQYSSTASTKSNCESSECSSHGPSQRLSKPGLQGLHSE